MSYFKRIENFYKNTSTIQLSLNMEILPLFSLPWPPRKRSLSAQCNCSFLFIPSAPDFLWQRRHKFPEREMNVRGHCNSAATARLQLPLFPLFGGKFREFPSAPPPLARSLRSPSIFHNLKVKAVIRDRRDALSDAPRPGRWYFWLTHS